MDIGGEGSSPDVLDHNDGEQRTNLNISDVFEAISLADPSFAAGVADAAVEDSMARAPAPHGGPFVRIVEQPASKALRFRYECEGRSAGSIPGVNSTQDRKTFPTIEIVGHTGKAIVVVSCVTREEPYKPHPHNLVGRDRCSRGVCTQKIDVTPDNALVTFSNLGIQCVKRRDIADALRVREELRVDPFRTGYAHRNQPQAIDLNAVRLCFQVFLPDEAGKVRHSLAPVVSDVIYDKKAMSDLHILRISSSAGAARGGTELILLCEKVTREDIAVVFYEERRDQGAGGGGCAAVVWEESANIVMVHKQVAIAFTAPAYRDPHTQEHVEVYIQLKRPTDGARSLGIPFTYIPEYQGTGKKPLPDLSLLTLLLADKRLDTNNNDKQDKHDKNEALVSSTSDSVNVSEESGSAVIADLNGNIEIIEEAEPQDVVASNEKSLNDLLDQVAELDEIYSENRTRLENATTLNNDNDMEEDFNDAGTYTSLQLAFKNPLPISEQELPYEDVQVQTYRGPIIEFTPLKRDTEEERAPPLPPKRVRKTTEQFKTSQTSVDSILKPGRQIPITRTPEVINRDRTELSVARSEPALPPVKKRSFFSRLFRRKEKSPAPSVKSEGKKESRGKPVGRSVSSVSGLRPSKFKSSVSHTSLKDNTSTAGLSYADSITHISLHGDENEKSTSQTSLRRPASLHPIPPTDGETILVAESVLALDANQFKKLQDDLDLTEAEHYALYMAVAPHATVSEFDETSCYYSPVDGSKFQN
ncbi:embryonic polarity protein dorsal isoform X2 [Pectinophora gossypiella]|uniref:embryonic polarity protein dorsal isoform X2 n=1 Tax=Pectinophora gossypiella TaxID=13191 RepID=UPI00214E3B9F|nr:embryonic polarity protein dorsal isoform X2 [Pectinophora gossypiella]